MSLLADKHRARRFYRILAQVYDVVNPLVWTKEMRASALDRLEIDSTDRVLDVGCGTGFATAALLARTKNVHGLDQSQEQLEKAWKKLGKHEPATFVFGDAERLPYAAETFDVVWSSGSIEYWPQPHIALQEFDRVLKPGGQVLVVGPKTPELAPVAAVAKRVFFVYDVETAEELFTNAGFEQVEHTTMGPKYRPEIAIATVGRSP